MNKTTLDRRAFLNTAIAAGALAATGSLGMAVPAKQIRLGVVVGVPKNGDPNPVIKRVRDFSLRCCQMSYGVLSASDAKPLRAALDKYKIEATAIVCLGEGRMVWDFKQGPATIGLVPRATRAARLEALKKASDIAKACSIGAVHTHCGFIPERVDNPLYPEVVAAIREAVAYCKNNGQLFLAETGQETPVSLLRVIRDVGFDNMGVNLDTANLILYGNGNPVDAMDVIGKYVWSLHAKDSMFPTDPMKLGEEVPIGKGRMDFPILFKRLKAVNFQGPVIIEREIEGTKQSQDIKASITYLQKLIKVT